MTHTIYALCVWAKSTHALFSREWSAFIVSLFSVGKKLRSRLSPFLERIGVIICPPRLGSSRCWGSEETEFAAIADEACERVWERGIFHLALDSSWWEWTAGGRCSLLHLLIQQEVLCWLMVCFWAFSACLPHDVELLEVMKRALLLGNS